MVPRVSALSDQILCGARVLSDPPSTQSVLVVGTNGNHGGQFFGRTRFIKVNSIYDSPKGKNICSNLRLSKVSPISFAIKPLDPSVFVSI